MRYIYTLIKGIQQRGALKKLRRAHHLTHVTALSPHDLQEAQIACLVLDFDGVLASHGEMTCPNEVEKWLQELVAYWPFPVVILSNKPLMERERYFKRLCPSIQFHKASKKKPYPEGLLAITKDYGLNPQQVLMVDDRLLTGCLAAVIAGTQAKYVYPAMANIKKRPIKETFFAGLRMLERLWF